MMSDIYSSSSIDYSGRSYLIVQESELNEIAYLSELENIAGLIIVQKSSKRINNNDKDEEKEGKMTIVKLTYGISNKCSSYSLFTHFFSTKSAII